MKRAFGILLFGFIGTAGLCTTTVNNNIPTAPTPATPTVTKSTVEFRVIGNANQARVRYSDPIDGLNQVVTSLPYSNSFSTTSAQMFLSLDVTPLSFPLLIANPFLAAQIVVDGSVFLSGTSNDTSSTVTISGTWRK
jgi:hypothetical protein